MGFNARQQRKKVVTPADWKMQTASIYELTLSCLLEDEIYEGWQIVFDEVIQCEIPVLGIFGRELFVPIGVSIAPPVQQPDVIPE